MRFMIIVTCIRCLIASAVSPWKPVFPHRPSPIRNPSATRKYHQQQSFTLLDSTSNCCIIAIQYITLSVSYFRCEISMIRLDLVAPTLAAELTMKRHVSFIHEVYSSIVFAFRSSLNSHIKHVHRWNNLS